MQRGKKIFEMNFSLFLLILGIIVFSLISIFTVKKVTNVINARYKNLEADDEITLSSVEELNGENAYISAVEVIQMQTRNGTI